MWPHLTPRAMILINSNLLYTRKLSLNLRFFDPVVFEKTSILRVLQAISSPLPVVYSIKIVQDEQN
jgi:hypothetical protein